MSVTPDKSLFIEYAKLKRDEAAVKAKIEELRPEVVAQIEAAGVDQVQTSDGSFSLSHLRTWTYGPAVDDIKATLEKEKEKQIADGTAEARETVTVVYRPLKKDV